MATAVSQGAAGNNAFKVRFRQKVVCVWVAKQCAGQGEAYGRAVIQYSRRSRYVKDF